MTFGERGGGVANAGTESDDGGYVNLRADDARADSCWDKRYRQGSLPRRGDRLR